MREIRTETTVDAPVDVVWDVLTDLPAYAEWNPHVTRVEGDLGAGADLAIVVSREGVRDRRMRVTVTDLRPERRLEWIGRVLSPRLFEGRHTVDLEPLGGGRTRVVNRERVSGVLAGLVVTDDPERDYEAANRALKTRAEWRLRAGTAT
jgi:hypothetical protein